MTYSLRKTPSQLHLAYKYGDASDNIAGRNFMLHVDGREMMLTIDLEANFHTRNKRSAAYLEVIAFAQNHHKLKYLQCSDNLVRSRLLKVWEGVNDPRLQMRLDLGARGQFIYSVLPHSLFMGGVQFDVLDVRQEEADPRDQEGQPIHSHLDKTHS